MPGGLALTDAEKRLLSGKPAKQENILASMLKEPTNKKKKKKKKKKEEESKGLFGTFKDAIKKRANL